MRKNTSITFRTTPELKAAIESAALSQNLSVSDLIHQSLQNVLQKEIVLHANVLQTENVRQIVKQTETKPKVTQPERELIRKSKPPESPDDIVFINGKPTVRRNLQS